MLVDLGLEEAVVGITKFCVHPVHLTGTKCIVGGTKNIKLDKIKALNPTHILCNKEENTKEIVEKCEKIAHTHVSEVVTIKDSITLIEFYGALFSREVESSGLIQEIKYKLNNFNSYIKNKPVLKVAYFIWKKPWMVAANNTYINHLLELNRFENIYKHKERYPTIEIEKIRLDGDPDILLLSSEPYPFKEKHALELENCTHNGKAIIVDGEFFSWHGSRLIKAFDYFEKVRERL